MNTAIIACKTLEDEVNQVVEKTGIPYRITWIESGLHNYPDRLRDTLQQRIDSITDHDYIIMLFGLCGNALLGLKSSKATMVVPKVDDCISLFLGGNEQRRRMENSSKSYYLTKGWLRYENNIWQEYQRSIEKYGLEKTRSIFRIMLKHYTHLVVIDTGAYDAKEFMKETKGIAAELGLELKIIPADLSIMTEALNHNWDKGFALFKPGQKIMMQDMGCCSDSSGQGLQL